MKIMDLFDHQVRESGGKEFIADAATRYTFAETDRRANQMAHVLITLGAGGTRVAVLAKNRIDYVLFFLAAAKVGAVAVPLNFRLAADEFDFIVNDSTATIVITEAEYIPVLDSLRSRLTGVDHYLTFEPDAPSGWASLAALADAAPVSAPPVEVEPDWALSQLYTSGTTGRPKGVVVSHGAMACQVEQEAHVLQPLGALRGRFLAAAPMYHAAVNFLWMTVAAWGGCVYVEQGFDPIGTAETMAREEIAWTLAFPAAMHSSLRQAAGLAGKFPHLRVIYYGGSTIDAGLLRASMDYFGCEFLQVYGLTETLGMVALQPADHHRGLHDRPELLGSAGRSLPGCRIGVIDLAGKLLPPGQVGEIVLRGPQIMDEYWHNAAATEETIVDGWIRTGDAGYLDGEGYLYITDRIKDMVISGGENIYPREIEEVLLAHRGVSEAAVIGIPDERWGESVAAVVALKDTGNVSEQELIDHCRSRLARYKVPKLVEFVPALPRNATGKVLKFQIRERYWAGHARRI